MVVTRRLTWDDFVALPDDEGRWEVFDEECHATPSPNTRHQILVGRLHLVFADHVRRHGGAQVFLAPLDVVLSVDPLAVVEPDLVVVADADVGIVGEANIRGAPTLLVEVLSDPRRDRVRKRALYARHGVPEYWVVDPVADRVEVHRLSGAVYPTPTLVEPGQSLAVPALPGLTVDVAALLAR
ncbi:MAG: Uma2 family endonuclease [Actinomycetota bacterium]|nr:Uma2 family endonuclease [Actinomycetota bacterium]